MGAVTDGGVGVGCAHDPERRSAETIDLPTLQRRDGASRVFARPGSQPTSVTRRDVFGECREG